MTTKLPIPPYRHRTSRRQDGVVLFIALIALLILTMTGIGFMRSVDTGSLLAGNLSFNRASVAVSDAAMEAARTQLLGLIADPICPNSASDPACLWYDRADSPEAGKAALVAETNGYFATWDPGFDHRNAAFWANSFVINNATLQSGRQQALSGYTIRYTVHRMCRDQGDPRTIPCVTALPQTGGGGEKHSADYSSGAGASSPDVYAPVYRITIRVEGPRNSLAYVQAWML